MGNQPQFDLKFIQEINNKKYYNIYLYKSNYCYENSSSILVFEDIEERNELKNFIDYVNIICNRLNEIKDDYKSYIKLEIENLLENYSDKKPQINKAFSNIDNLEGIQIACSLFEFIYSEKNNIGQNKIYHLSLTFKI